MYCYEEDRLQCAAKNQTGKRCSYTATHSDGKQALCERHMQIARRERANNVPIKEKTK
jgi:hypothetical protein